MNLSARVYSINEVANVAEVRPATLRSWLARKDFAEFEDSPEGGGRQGRTRSFSFEHMVAYAIASKATSAGLQLDKALYSGLSFAFSSFDQRHPGVPFQKGITYLLVSERYSTEIALPDRSVDFWAKVRGAVDEVDGGVFVLPVNELWNQVCRKLGLEPEDVMRAVYEGAS